MTIKTRKVVVSDITYHIKQHPAAEGCALLEKYYNAINAFVPIQSQPVFEAANKQIIPFKVMFHGKWLALTMFMDRLANPNAPLDRKDSPQVQSPYPHQLTVREIKEGKTLADREDVIEPFVPMPLSTAIQYKATPKHESSVDVDSVLAQFLRYVTLEGEELNLDTITFTDLSDLLAHVLVFNFLHIWDKQRFSLPENYSTGHDSPASVQRARAQYSQPNVIYTILQSKLNLASYADLATSLSTEDAFEMNEAALLAYYEEAEAQKEAERQAKSNRQ
ncbi:hypothetical protein C5I_0109225 [Pseudomonas syringae pv. syringae FF5]|nr:hypothetical protein C5I_0109225 [Pseudomonas syringae pv. syringae FF5]